MRISKLKSISLAITALSMAALSTSAYAQIGVKDETAGGLLGTINESADGIEEDTETLLEDTQEAFRQQATHREEEIKHHEANIARLNAMISLLNAKAVVGDDNAFNIGDASTLSNPNIFDGNPAGESAVAALNTSRDDIATLRTDAESVFNGGTISDLSSYLKEYDLQSVDEIYDDNDELARGVLQLYHSAYNAESTVNTISQASADRLSRYDELLGNAKTATDLKTALDINNALLLENGKNLALLIDLQTAQLDAQAVQLRKEAQNRNAVTRTFGESNGAGLEAIRTAVGVVETVASVVN